MTLFLLETYTNKVGALTSTLIVKGTKFISLCLISVTYLKIRKRLRDTNPAVALEAHNRKTVEQNVRLSRTIFLVIGLLFGLWLPALVIGNDIYILVIILHSGNSLVNPIVYIFKMPIFRAVIRKFIRDAPLEM